MADTFNGMRKLDREHLDREVGVLIETYHATGKVPDFVKLHKAIVKAYETTGVSKKGAQAQATLRIVDMKRLMDPTATPY